MILGIGAEAGVFLYAGLAGMEVLFGYDILICLRNLIPHGRAAVGIEDLVFWIGASGYIFSRMYETTFGSIRWFFVLGLICGAILGHVFTRFILKISAKAKKGLEKYKKSG